MQYSDAQDFLNSFINYEKVKPDIFPRHFHLVKMEKLLSLLGNPHKKFKSIHIAGSKGKGSTSAMTANVLHEVGFKTGLYTSPHIYDYHERIRILGDTSSSEHLFKDVIGENAFAQCLTEMRPAIEEVGRDAQLGPLSFFEIFTALAFYYFAKQNIDYAVVETGLGGRLDATNVLDSDIAVITTIDYEHMHVLGSTLKEIAQEKAGIVKNKNQYVVVAPQENEAELAIFRRCMKIGCPFVRSDQNIRYELVDKTLRGQRINIHVEDVDYNVYLPLVGAYQVMNLFNVIETVRYLNATGVTISKEHVEQGIEQVSWPIRFEVISQLPVIILDAAHTGQAMMNLSQSLQEYLPGKTIKMIMGVSEDKDLATLCMPLQKLECDVILTKADHPRAKDIEPEDVRAFFKHVEQRPTVAKALALALGDLNDCILVVTGSIFVASEARDILLKDKKHVSI